MYVTDNKFILHCYEFICLYYYIIYNRSCPDILTDQRKAETTIPVRLKFQGNVRITMSRRTKKGFSEIHILKYRNSIESFITSRSMCISLYYISLDIEADHEINRYQ